MKPLSNTSLQICRAFLLGVSLLCEALFSTHQASADQGQIQASLLFDKKIFQPAPGYDEPVGRIGVLLKIAPGWHTYWKNSGEAALATKIEWQLPAGWRAGELEWPVPKRFLERGKIVTYGYTDEVLLSAALFAPTVIPDGDQTLVTRAKVNWLVCNEICVPGSARVESEMKFSASLAEQASENYQKFSMNEEQIPRPLELIPHEKFKISSRTVQEDNKLIVSIKLSGARKTGLETLGSSLQYFPLEQFPLKLRAAPEARFLEEESGSAIDLRLIYGGKLPENAGTPGGPSDKLHGIVALDGKLTQSGKAVAFPVEFGARAEASAHAEPSPASGDFVPLRYRLEDHSGSKPEPNSPSSTPSVASKGNTISADSSSAPGSAASGGELVFALALLYAFVGGLILNLMPCVLPIISIKIMGFVESGSQSRRRALASSLSFAGGILISMLSLAIGIIVFRSVGYSMGWGFQFQHPSFVFFLTVIVFVLSLSFFDLYSIELPYLNQANKFASTLRSPHLKSFFDGVLATALSTPCTAPFLGTALAFAFAQPAWKTILIFIFIGFGLAVPYVLLATSPRLSRLLPTPGMWMFRFRQFLGFLLLGTVLWLLFVLHALSNVGAVWAAWFLLIVFFALWLIRGFGEQKVQAGIGRLILAAAIICFAFAKIYPRVLLGERTKAGTSDAIPWRAFSEEELQAAAQQGKVSFVDFTADWCITCKTNELLVIDTAETAEKIRASGIVPIRADWTTGDEAITQALKRYGAEGVPLYVVVPPGGKAPIVFSGIISKTSLYRAFEQAGST